MGGSLAGPGAKRTPHTSVLASLVAMPQLTVTWRHGVAALTGAALAASGLFLGGGFERAAAETPADDPQVTTTTSPPAVPIIAEGEALIGNTVLVPLEVRTSGNAVVLDYSLTSLGGAAVTAAPERFVLATADGSQYPGSLSSPEARSVRFEGAAEEVVTEIVVTTWRQRMYEDYETELSLTEGAVLTDGTRIQVDRILEETVGALLYFSIDTGFNRGFQGREFTGPLIVSGGIGWQDTLDVSTTGTSTFFPSLSVTEDPVPDPVPLRVVARPWVPREEIIVVYRSEGTR